MATGWDVTAKKPYDILSAVLGIMHAQNYILDRIPPEQKLVVLLPESHSHFRDSAIQTMLLNAALFNRAARSFAYGTEFPHDFVRRYGNDNQADIKNNYDPRLLETFNKHPDVFHCHSATRETFKFCLGHKISVGFNDLSQYGGGNEYWIDQTNNFTRDLISRHRPDLLGQEIVRVGKVQRSGVQLSNLAMAELATTHIKDTEAKIYYQSCGRVHAWGYKNTPYKDSLERQLLNKGHAVLTVVSYDKDLHDFWGYGDYDAMRAFSRSVRLHNLDPGHEDKISYSGYARKVNEDSGIALFKF